jgi:ribosomal protein S18 acetylase RimI-like enzyme
MKVREYTTGDRPTTVALIAEFRVALSALRGRVREPDRGAAAAELEEYVRRGFPIRVAETESGELAGYLVCRVDGDTVWAESLFVRPGFRRRGVAGMLFDEAERLAAERGEPTVYNWVHPNNEPVLEFLRSRGYDVLNLIEVRRARPGEDPAGTMAVGDREFRY